MDRRAVVPLTALAAALAAAGPASAEPPEWSFRTYANDVRVVPPLVGDWQLGVSRSNGRGVGFNGSIRDTFDPHRQKYSPVSMSARVTGYRYRQAAHGVSTTLILGLEIESTDAPRCAAGDTGKLKLVDSTLTLDNGESADTVSMSWAHDRCPSFVQGWSNADGGEKTRPAHGGPPNGGQWAVVRIG